MRTVLAVVATYIAVPSSNSIFAEPFTCTMNAERVLEPREFRPSSIPETRSPRAWGRGRGIVLELPAKGWPVFSSVTRSLGRL